MTAFARIIKHEISLTLQKGGMVVSVLAFFVVAVSLFPFGIGAKTTVIASVAPGVIWVCALLASTIALPRMFDEDYDDGSLAQLMLQQTLPEIIIAAKVVAHWLVTAVPLMLVMPLVALLLGLEWPLIMALMISLLLGTPTLSLIGAIGASLTLGLKRGNGMIATLVLPLYIPVLIFAVAMVTNEEHFISSLSFLIGLFLLMLPLSIVASVYAIRMALEES